MQNTSHAVMAQRVEPHDSLDDFPTPPWATRALLEHVIQCGGTAWEPAANRGHMVKPLEERFGWVRASDVHDYGYGYEVKDFLFGDHEPVDWIITNPPFRLAEQFIYKGLETAKSGVAIFVRSTFLEGVGRYSNLFTGNPPAVIAQFAERVVLHKGRLAPKGSTATAYCWVVWYPHPDTLKNAPGTRFQWIPPCRRELERESDYV